MWWRNAADDRQQDTAAQKHERRRRREKKEQRWKARWAALGHITRWSWLGALYLVLFAWIFGALGAWQFQDRLRATVSTPAEAYALRLKLASTAATFDTLVEQLVDKMRVFPVIEEPDRGLFAKLFPGASATIPDGPAQLSPEELMRRLTIFKAMQDQAGSLKQNAAALVDKYRLGFGLLQADLKNPITTETSSAALLADVASAQSMELGLLRRTGVLAFAEPPMQRLVTWPEGHLTILLTLLMGMLGSTLYTTRFMLDYAVKGYKITEPAPYPTSWFVFRPLFGAATALAIFVLFKAGQLAFSVDGAATNAPLNPFIIAFMAIVAGLMSWQALDLIQTTGSRWLASQSREPLWAVGLRRALDERQRSIDVLAVQIGCSRRQVDRWLRFRDRVYPEMQQRILVSLTDKEHGEVHVEQVFGDTLPKGLVSPPARLAKDLAAALAAADRTVGEVALRLNVSRDIVGGWIERKTPVEPIEQEALADMLDRPVDDLFEPVAKPGGNPPPPPSPQAPQKLAIVMKQKNCSEQQLATTLTNPQRPVDVAKVQAWLAEPKTVPDAVRRDIEKFLGVTDKDIDWS